MTRKNPHTLAAALADLDAARRRLEARLARESKTLEGSGTAAALSQTYATDFELVAFDRQEQRLRAEQSKAERSTKARAAFDLMLDDFFPGNSAEDNPNPTATGDNAGEEN